MKSSEVLVRYSVRDLQAKYDTGDRKPLEDLVRAWRGIQALPPSDPNSFFALGGLHGEPFNYRPAVDALSPTDIYMYWGGWCNHGNILFPTWHRVYVLKLERALQRIVPGVTLPFWDETSEESERLGIPHILTQEKFELDGASIDNPLRSFELPAGLSDHLGSDDEMYRKPKGYQTVRYPLSGLVGTAAALAATAAHNAQHRDPVANVQNLNDNIIAWLHGLKPTPSDPNPTTSHGVTGLFRNCLHAPNYTVFSNTTSAAEWNRNNPDRVVALESPHNDIHLAVGGFDLPGPGGGESGQIADANGDMGENNTAGLDPIFFFHHCNVDRVFWLWQKLHQQTNAIEVADDHLNYAGTSSYDSQGPTPDVAPGTKLSLDSPLAPFNKDDGTAYTSRDCINIETQLGYTYGPGSLDDEGERKAAPALNVKPGFSRHKLSVSGIDRALFAGSFVLRAYATVTDAKGESTEYCLGHHSVLSRRNVVKCANCLTHQEVLAHFSLSSMPESALASATYRVEIQHRGAALPSAARTATSGSDAPASTLPDGLTMALSVQP